MKTGIFFDGYHAGLYLKGLFTNNYHYTWLDYNKLIGYITNSIRTNCEFGIQVNYKAWYQGINRSLIPSKNDTEWDGSMEDIIWAYHNDRTLYISLINSGIETIFLEMKQSGNNRYEEKGIDVALSVGVINHVNELGLECVIICTNDSDFEPLLHNLRKKGILTIVVGFNEKGQQAKKLKLNADLIYSFDEIVSRELLNDLIIDKDRPDYSNLLAIKDRINQSTY